MKKCDFCKHDRSPLVETREACKTCCNFDNFQLKSRMTERESYEYEKLKKEEKWIDDDSVNFDRGTALMVLNALSSHMHASHDIYGNPTLVINRHRFEAVRKKYLDKHLRKKEKRE